MAQIENPGASEFSDASSGAEDACENSHFARACERGAAIFAPIPDALEDSAANAPATTQS